MLTSLFGGFFSYMTTIVIIQVSYSYSGVESFRGGLILRGWAHIRVTILMHMHSTCWVHAQTCFFYTCTIWEIVLQISTFHICKPVGIDTSFLCSISYLHQEAVASLTVRASLPPCCSVCVAGSALKWAYCIVAWYCWFYPPSTLQTWKLHVVVCKSV